ncbi:MAG: DNA repair exonuclease [Pseudomonadota bacterium]
MIKFIHAADIHLDSPLHRLEAYEGAPVDEIRQASRRAFENLIELAIDESVDFVLLAGDLFDGDWKDYNTGLFFISQLGRLREAGIRIFIVSGNHDAAGQVTKTLPCPDNTHIFSPRKAETVTMDTLKVAVHGQSFATAAIVDNLAAGYPEPVPGCFNIGLLHTSLTGREGHQRYAPCSIDDLKNRGYDYWALGHVHKDEIVSLDPPVVFSGCIQGRHIRETGCKGCMLVTVGDDSPVEIVHRPLDVVRWEVLAVDLTGAINESDCLNRFTIALGAGIDRHAPLPVIVRVVFCGETTHHQRMAGDPVYWREAVRAAALSHFGDQSWIEKIRLNSTPPKRIEENPPAVSGPLAELNRMVAELAGDDAQLLELGAELSPLFQKLPAEYRQSEEAFRHDDPEGVRAVVAAAHAMLAKRLLKEGDPSENP